MANLVRVTRRDNNGLTRPVTGLMNFHNILDDFFNGDWTRGMVIPAESFKIDVEETEGFYRVEAELPGVKREEIEIETKEDVLRISVNRAEETSESKKNYIHRERRSEAVCREIRLINADFTDIKAKLSNGVLSITAQKKDRAENAKKIEIE